VTVDNNGNLTHFTHDYVYNWKNQLVKVNTGTGVNVEYKYDALGRRIVKKVKAPNSSDTVTRYVHDGYQVIEERNGSDQVTYRYTYGNGIDERIEIERREKNQDGNYEWKSYLPIHDSIGNVTALTNDKGHLIERYNYSPYGEVTYFNTESAPGIDYVRIKDGVIRIKFDRPVDPGKIYIHLYIKSTQEVITGDKEYIDIEEIGYRTSTLPTDETLTLNLKNQSGPGEPIDIFSQDFIYQGQADVIVHDGGKPYVKKEVQVENNIVIIFNEEIDSNAATYEVELETNNIKIDGTLVRTGSNEYKFIPSGGLVKDAQYMLRMSGFKDLPGNAMDDLEHSFVSTYNNTLIFEASILTANNHSVVGNTSLMHGRDYEPEVGLYYYRNRYYHPQLGRFLQQDPNGYEDSLNTYQAFNQNPVNFTDPFGTIIEKEDLYELKRIIKSQGPKAAKRWIDKNSNFTSGEKLDLHMKVWFGFDDPKAEVKINYVPVWDEFWAFIDETAYKMSKPYLKFHAGVKHRRYDIAAEGLVEIGTSGLFGGLLMHYIPEGISLLTEKFPILKRPVSSFFKSGTSTTGTNLSLGFESSEFVLNSEGSWVESLNDPYAGVKQASEYLKSIGATRAERVQILQSFDVRTIRVCQAGDDMFAIRFHDFGETARPSGQYLFETFSNQINRSNLALPPQWNKMIGIKQWQIKPGTIFFRGKIAPQLNYGLNYIGGANQIFVYKPWLNSTLID
jgi:RHS repeat-associated protein